MGEIRASSQASAAVGHSRIAGALFGKTQRGILGLLFPNSQRDFSLSEVVRAVGTGMGAVQRELTRLVGAGLVTRTRRGNQVLYQANREAPVFSELRDLMVKTAGVADVVREALGGLSDRIEVAFIYGSMARGEEDSRSDVDVMVIGDVSFGEVANAIHHSQSALSREVNPTVYPRTSSARRPSLDTASSLPSWWSRRSSSWGATMNLADWQRS